jgi:transcriptional activator for dhaKLM operon
MQSSQPVTLDTVASAHEEFLRTGRVDLRLDPLTTQSWQRCAPRVNPFAPLRLAQLNENVFRLTLNQYKDLIRLAQPLLEDVAQAVEGTDLILILSDSTTCILLVVGDPAMVGRVATLGIRPGTFLDESRAGTNAFAIAQLEGCPAHIIGPEHFTTALQAYTTAAAPVYGLDGHPGGTVGVIAPRDTAVQALGLVVAVAKSIENQLLADQLLAETHVRATELNATIDSISEGVLAWDARSGRVMHANVQAGQLLDVRAAELLGRPLTDHITAPEVLARAISRGEPLSDVVMPLITPAGTREVLLSLRIVHDLNQQPVTYIATLRRIEHVRQLVNQLVGAQARLTLDDLAGDGPAARKVRRQALSAADAKASVLVLGESGTGKNILARAIHNSSRRAAGPFLAINCRAIPRELALAEFLGYEAGTFSNAPGGDQPSKFELADGGTLFLEEIDALPLDMQSALLRIIEAGDVIRLGGRRVMPVDVRIIAASHEDLEARAAEGSFRRDLLFRLSSFVIHIPPLRKRREDLNPLLNRALDRLRSQLGRSLKLTDDARAALLSYSWPGNVRELQTMLDRLALSVEDGRIGLDHLPANIRRPQTAAPMAAGNATPMSLAEAERTAIQAALQASDGNHSATARLLGISRSTLWRKLRELQERESFLPPA